MTFVTKKHLSRRTMLRGMGVAISLPLLDSMIPALSAATKTAAKVQPRFGFVYVPHGAVMDKWTPIGTGTDFELSPVLTALSKHRENVIVLSNLRHHMADALGDGGADHSRATATWLNGTHAKKTEGEDVRAGTTIDQMAAEKIGQETRFPSLEIATEDMTGLIGACDVGYSCAYMNTISWRNPTTPNPMEINPRVVFERLFGEGGSLEDRLARMDEDKSILDQITGSVPRLEKNLGARDRTRMSEYLENVREIERRLQIAEKQAGTQVAVPSEPVGVPDSYEEHVGLMYDMMALAYQSDTTRVFSFMMARELSQRSYPQVGVPDPHHATSHHQDNPEKLAKLVKIQHYHLSLFAKFLDKLKATPDGDGNLLDHTTLLYGSCLSNSNIHSHNPLPTLLAGGGAGTLKGGRHLKYPENTAMANLLLTLLNKVGIPAEKVGDSTGPLTDV
ncbi:MAG: DUF1552 domain-containing protein [Bryobacterales bacterium]|nr:DUF1552 domain-containing protein [Bryobacterales bacterium]